ncbi:MAG: SpoIID/LytB domain-containing protein [Cyclobacteriaceae bacterium]|nr:SpoIID/LytB domain-containing protein [Cyclobacteriaceae bacterium]
MKTIPTIDVGIMSEKEIAFVLDGEFTDSRHDILTGEWSVWIEKDNIYLSNHLISFPIEDGFVLTPTNVNKCSFLLKKVTIGVNFHWQRQEDQRFKGAIKLLIDNGNIAVINRLSIEDYLSSVISSEMSATSSAELLKAHAVISRSWLLAQIQKNKNIKQSEKKYSTLIENDEEHIKWYDREDHQQFDVCADDHCQRYQGITRASTAPVATAISDTFGQVLVYEGAICDARFSKCCGGMAEEFQNVWEPTPHPYLQMVLDSDQKPGTFDLNLQQEEAARAWILGRPLAFCNTDDKKILGQVLNDYDQETNDFFRWQVSYTQKELSELFYKRIGIDVGLVTDLEPLERGVSGRLVRLKVKGTKKTMVIGKELEIRKAMSESHLYSSAIVFEKKELDGALHFVLHGAGWGHGVGLCQIGAAVMGAKGYSYRQILEHYFIGGTLEKRY